MRALALLVAGSLIAAAALTPPLYALVVAIWPDPPWPFRRVFDRVGMLAALGIVLHQRRRLGLEHLTRLWRREGWAERSRAVAAGCALAFGSGLLVAWLLLGLGALERSAMAASRLAPKLALDLPGAVVVGLVEEGFFRVLVLEAMRRRLGTMPAVLASSAFYAALHFLRPDRGFVWDGFTPGIGFRYLASILGALFTPQNAPALVGLFLIGIVLAGARLRTDSFGLCIGLHAGWFLVRKLVVRATAIPGVSAASARADEPSWHVLGHPAAWASIVVVGAAVFLLAPRFDRRAAPPSAGGAGALERAPIQDPGRDPA